VLKTLLFSLLAVFLLLAGCSTNGEDNKESKPAVSHVQSQEAGTLKDALKQYKFIKVKDVTDARKTTGQLTVVVQLDDSQGARSQVGAVMSFTDKFIAKLKDKPKKVTVGVMYQDQRVFQYTKDVQTKKTTVDAKSAPEITKYLKQAGYLK